MTENLEHKNNFWEGPRGGSGWHQHQGNSPIDISRARALPKVFASNQNCSGRARWNRNLRNQRENKNILPQEVSEALAGESSAGSGSLLPAPSQGQLAAVPRVSRQRDGKLSYVTQGRCSIQAW